MNGYTTADPRPERFTPMTAHFVSAVAACARDVLLYDPDSPDSNSSSSAHQLLQSLIGGTSNLNVNRSCFSALMEDTIQAAHRVYNSVQQDASVHFIYWINLLVFVARYNL